MTARLALSALLGAALAGPAQGFVRSTDASTGACLYWGSRGVTYHLNPGRDGTSPSCGPITSNGAAAQAVEDGFAAWTGASEACTDVALTRGADSSNIAIGYVSDAVNENLVVFRSGWCDQNAAAMADPCWTEASVRCSGKFNCFGEAGVNHGVIALTTMTYRPSTGEIVDADMEFIDWTGQGDGTAVGSSRDQGWYFTCSDPGSPPDACVSYGEAGCDFMDLRNTATHEAGHFVGFAHVPASDFESTMAATAAIGETKKRSLEASDVTGLCTVYPKGQVALTCAPACASGPLGVCDDSNPCTDDACDASLGCTHAPKVAGSPCLDGNACNGAETCDASGACVLGAAPSCDDANSCTADFCTTATGCANTKVSDGTACSANCALATCQVGICTCSPSNPRSKSSGCGFATGEEGGALVLALALAGGVMRIRRKRCRAARPLRERMAGVETPGAR